MEFTLTSTAFEDGQPIPRRYSGEGEDRSPLLKWSDPPPRTQSFALICEDPDAPHGTFTHWVAFNIPAASRELSEDQPREDVQANGLTQGKNSFDHVGYNGPKPPPGKPHRYFFKLYALNGLLDLAAGATKEELLKAMDGHVVGEAPLMGTYVHGQRSNIPEDLFAKKGAQDRASLHTAPLG
jgi:Raf kinase inhibitor-like YbhB/YbcL family protein